MPKQRVHNEYFRCISLKHCPICNARNVQVWSWGEYVNGKWRTVSHFCNECIQQVIEPRLLAHAKQCGCTFELKGYAGTKLSENLIAIQDKINQLFAPKSVAEQLKTAPVIRMSQIQVMNCPFLIIDSQHFREDGTCKCDDALERKKMIREWEYTEESFKNIPLRT